MLSTEYLGKVNGVILKNVVCRNISIIHCHSYTSLIIMIFIITMHNQQITIAYIPPKYTFVLYQPGYN